MLPAVEAAMTVRAVSSRIELCLTSCPTTSTVRVGPAPRQVEMATLLQVVTPPRVHVHIV
jgi:hypothetical protein